MVDGPQTPRRKIGKIQFRSWQIVVLSCRHSTKGYRPKFRESKLLGLNPVQSNPVGLNQFESNPIQLNWIQFSPIGINSSPIQWIPIQLDPIQWSRLEKIGPVPANPEVCDGNAAMASNQAAGLAAQYNEVTRNLSAAIQQVHKLRAERMEW